MNSSGTGVLTIWHTTISFLLMGCVPTDGLAAVEAACQEALDHGVCSASVIINILARSRDPAPAATLQIPDALRLAHEGVADCALYDRLRRVS